MKTSSAARRASRQRATEPVELVPAHARDLLEPLGGADEAAAQHRDPFRRERVRASRHEPRQVAVDTLVVHGVAELVEHRLHPPFAGLHVAQDADVALAVDVDAERVLVLTLAPVQITVGEHRAHVESQPVVGPDGQRLEVGVEEQWVKVDRAARGGSWKNGSSRCHGASSSRATPKRSARASSSVSFQRRNGVAV